MQMLTLEMGRLQIVIKRIQSISFREMAIINWCQLVCSNAEKANLFAE